MLSDRIVVIADGGLKCVGNSLYLKNTFGGGYRIDIYCDPNDQEKLIGLMSTLFPQFKLIDTAGGSLVY